MADLLFVRPSDDAAASLISTIGNRLLRMAQFGVGIPSRTTHDLAGSANATRAMVDNELRQGPGHLFYFGHGVSGALVANGSALVDATNIISLPASAVVVAVACYSRAGLGVSATTSGAVTAYLGWDDQLPIPHLHPVPMVDAIFSGLAPLLLGQDVDATKQELVRQFSTALSHYKQWQAPPTAGSGAALFAKMAPAFAIACLDVEGSTTATL